MPFKDYWLLFFKTNSQIFRPASMTYGIFIFPLALRGIIKQRVEFDTRRTVTVLSHKHLWTLPAVPTSQRLLSCPSFHFSSGRSPEAVTQNQNLRANSKIKP